MYASLQRMREHARQEAQVLVRSAEEERDRSLARVTELQVGVARARAQVDPGSSEDVAVYQSFRLQEALRERREAARLAQRERELEARRVHHQHAVREELTLDALVDQLHEGGKLATRRHELRQMDDLAALRRRG